MRKLFEFLLIQISAVLLAIANVQFQPRLLIEFIASLYLTTIFHELIHIFVYILNNIRIAAIICSPCVVVFYPRFKITLLPRSRLLTGGEVVPNFSNGCIPISVYYRTTKISLLLAPVFSFILASLALILFFVAKNTFLLFVFINNFYIIINSFFSDGNMVGDIAAYKRMCNEKWFFAVYYYNNLLIVHGDECLYRALNNSSDIFQRLETTHLSREDRENCSYLLFLYATLVLAGYEFDDEKKLIMQKAVFLLKESGSKTVNIAVIRMLGYSETNRNKDNLSCATMALQLDGNLQTEYIVKQAETYNHVFDNSEYLLQNFSKFVEDLDYHNLFFSGWVNTEQSILEKCISAYNNT